MSEKLNQKRKDEQHMKRTDEAIIEKIDQSGKITRYGKNFIIEVIPKNYKYNGMFWECPNTKTIYITTKG